MGARVLVADDIAENRALAKATLEDEGYTVALANDGEQAIAAFSTEQPECVLLDIRMPNTDGIEACRRIRALPGGEHVAIIFVTAQRDVETLRTVRHPNDACPTKAISDIYLPEVPMLDSATILALATLLSSLSNLIWSLRRKPG